MKTHKIIHTLITFTLLTQVQTLFAAETDESKSYKFEKAVSALKEQPLYPRGESREGKEGWVILSYVVEKDGNVSDPIVEDSSGSKSFEKATLKAIKKWKYSPATINGKPTEQCNTRAKFVFQLSNTPNIASKKFFFRYKKIARQIDSNKLAEAEKGLTDLKTLKNWNLYEDAWYWLLKSEFYTKTNDSKNALSSLRKAVAYEGIYLPIPNYTRALKNLYMSEVNSGLYADALRTSKILEIFKKTDPTINKLLNHANTLRETISSMEVLSATGDITHDTPWRYDLTRKEFSFSVKSGNIATFDLRCERKRKKFNITTDASWKIPDKWGECTIFVYGDNEAIFQIHEYLPENKT